MIERAQAYARRAPRLTPEQRIAGHVTRAGRFRRIDPAKPKRPPTFWALVGRLGWAVLVVESLRRARARVRQPAGGTAEDAGAPSGAAGPAQD